MCLTLRKRASLKPYTTSHFRWKVVTLRRIGGGSFFMVTSQYRSHRWLGRWMVAAARTHYIRTDATSFGFHVYTSCKVASRRRLSGDLVVKVEVRGFLRSGTFSSTRSETWRKAKIVEFYYNLGRKLNHTWNKAGNRVKFIKE